MTELKLLPPTTAENWEAQNITGRVFCLRIHNSNWSWQKVKHRISNILLGGGGKIEELYFVRCQSNKRQRKALQLFQIKGIYKVMTIKCNTWHQTGSCNTGEKKMQKRTSLDQLTNGNTDGKSDKSIRSMSIYGVNYCAMTM